MTDSTTRVVPVSLTDASLLADAGLEVPPAPLSYGQRALWFLQRLEPDNPAYNVARAVRVRGAVDLGAIRRVFQALVDRHPPLRSTYEFESGRPVRRVHREMPVDFTVEDAEGWTEEELQARLAAETRQPFDLAQGSMMRVRVFRRADDDHIGQIVLHHIATDLWSWAILLYEIDVLYAAELKGEPVKLRAHPSRYEDYVAQQQKLLAGPEGERLRAFWLDYLSGDIPALALPTDRQRPVAPTYGCSDENYRLSPALTAALRALAESRGTSLYTTLLAAFQVLLHRLSGQTSFLVGSPVAGRGHRVASQIGYFVNSLAIKADLTGDPTFLDYLARADGLAAAAHEHAAYPFPLLVEQLAPVRTASHPLFQVMFAWQKTTSLVDPVGLAGFILQEPGGRMPLGDVYHESLRIRDQVGPFDLTLLMAESGDQVIASAGYATDLFDAATIRRILRAFELLLEGIVADPARAISAYDLLDAAERAQVLAGWNATAAPFPDDRGIHQLVEAQADRTPDAIAVASDAESLTYAELDRRANRLAHRLRALGVGADTLVGLCLERSVDAVVGLLGILKAGGAYLPLDAAYPADRLAYMLDDARIPVLITHSALESGLPAHSAAVLRLDTDAAAIAAESDARPAPLGGADGLAYVIYTSGSTGRPKGVLVGHRGLCNLVSAQSRAFEVGPASRVLQFASLSFDAAVSEIFMALTTGACLVLARQDQLFGGVALESVLREQAITVVTLPPALLATLSPGALPALRTLVSAGEALSWDVARRWAAPGRTVINAYGPTEATIGPTYYKVNGHPATTATVPIGRPISNTQIYLLDPTGRPVPIGVPGEIYVGGVGVARGYLNRPELTAEKFVPRPAELEGGSADGELRRSGRLYRTGDRARWLADGNLEYLGRVDRQVKVRGFRIEPEEVEAVLTRLPGVREGVVLAREDTPGDRRLVAYVVPGEREGAPVTPQALRADLLARLPSYMVPTHFVMLDAFPLTPNGKVDRKALPVPTSARTERGGFARPETELQRSIAGIWREVLQLDEVGLNDNFFDLGGHSLLAVEVHDRIQQLLGRELSMVELFRYPTVGTLAEYLGQAAPAAAAASAGRSRGEKQREALERRQQQMRAAAVRRPPARPSRGEPQD